MKPDKSWVEDAHLALQCTLRTLIMLSDEECVTWLVWTNREATNGDQ